MHRFAGLVAAGLRKATGEGSIGGTMDLRDNIETGEAESNREFFYVPIPDEAPCKKEQEKLSGVVKNLHRKLRRKYKEGKRLHWAPAIR